MSNSARYASLDYLQDRLTSRSEVAGVLDYLLDAASTAVEELCGRVFTLAEEPSARDFCVLSPTLASVDDIATATGVEVSVRAGDSSWSALADWWLLPPNEGALGRPFTHLGAGSLPVDPMRPTLRVTAVWGWQKVPAPVTEAVLLIASRLYARRDSPTGVAGFGDMGVVRVSSTDVDVTERLRPYIRRGF